MNPSRPFFQRLEPYLYVLPAVLFVGVFLLYPMAYTLWQSFTDADGLKPPQWVGLENYLQLLRDPNFLRSLFNTLIWLAAAVAFPVGLGFVLALIFEKLPGGAFFKSSVYFPYAFSAAATAVLFSFIFDPLSGAANTFFRAVGLETLSNTRWLIDSPINTFSMIAAYTWQGTGINMLILLIGLQNLPKEPMEAAKIDGASGWTMTRTMTLPLMRPFVTIAALMAAINGFKVFDLIWVMTQGGPGRSSETLAVTMYREGFISFNQGYSASIAVVIAAIALTFAYFYLRAVLRREEG